MLPLHVWLAMSATGLVGFFRSNLEIITKDTYFILSSKFRFPVCKMAAISLDTVLVLSEMLTECRLIQVVKLLASLLLLGLHDGNWNVLRH